MKKTIRLLGAAATLPLVLACANGAHAQSIDYGSLQQLFNEPVTTSATGSPQRSTEVPVDMDIISAEDIKRSGARDLRTILSRVPGLDVMMWTAAGSDIGVRGYANAQSPRLLVLINGRQVYLDHYGMTSWGTLPVQLSEIRQIEVVKGPNSALFGFNAVGGVVNIITYNPKYDDEGSADVIVGTNSYREASLVKTLKLGDRISARVSAGAYKQDEWSKGAYEGAVLRDPERIAVNLDALAQLTDKTEFRFESSLSNTMQTEKLTVGELSPTKYLLQSVKGTLSSDTKAGLLQLSAYRNDNTIRVPIDKQITIYKNQISVVNVQDLLKIGSDHTVRLSAEYRHNELNTNPEPGGMIIYDVYTASGMWNWAVTDKLSLTAAARYDAMRLKREGTFPAGYPTNSNSAWDRDINETTYNLGAVWRPTQVDSLRLTAARGAQLPSLIDFGGLQLTVVVPGIITFAVTGNPYLDPTIVTNYGLAYERALPTVNAKFAIRGFVQKSEGVKGQPVATELDGFPSATSYALLTYRNVSDSKLKGVEVQASGDLEGGFRWGADYTWTDVRDEGYDGFNIDNRLVAFQLTTPKSRGNVNLGWSDDKWSADGYLHFISDFAIYDHLRARQSVAGYATLAGRVARSFDRGFTVAVSGENLLKDNQVQTKSLNAERRLLLSVSKSW